MRRKKRDNMLFNATNSDDLAPAPQSMDMHKVLGPDDVYDTRISEHMMDGGGRGYDDDNDYLSEIVDTQSSSVAYDDHRSHFGSAYKKKR